MIMTNHGIAIRMAVKDIRVAGRATQGVRLIRLKKDDQIASVVKVVKSDEDDDEPDDAVIVDQSEE